MNIDPEPTSEIPQPGPLSEIQHGPQQYPSYLFPLLGTVLALLVAVAALLFFLLPKGSAPEQPTLPPIGSEADDPSTDPDPAPEGQPNTEPTTPPPVAPPTTQPEPTVKAPVLKSFALFSPQPKDACSDPTVTETALLVEWESDQLNNSTSLVFASAGTNNSLSSLPSNGSWEYWISCSMADDITITVTLFGAGNQSATKSLNIKAPATVEISNFTVQVYNVLTPSGTLMQECLEATKPFGTKQATVRIQWDTRAAASVRFERTTTPNSPPSAVFTNPSVAGSQMSIYQCSWTSASYTLIATGHDGTEVRRTVTISG